jgi:uncharacterized protein YmfQ (DUF2313 family)
MANWAALQPADFETAVAQRLLPRGAAWTRLVGSVLQRVWNVIADAVAAVHGRSAALTEIEGFPPTSVELLPDWETVFGLPDPCLGLSPTTAARQQAVAARLIATGGQSVGYFAGLAAALGATVEVTEYAPFRASVDVAGAAPNVIGYFEASVSAAGDGLWTLSTAGAFAGGALRNASWAYVWLVTLTGTEVEYFHAEQSHAGEPLWSLPGGVVACEIQRLAPAHTLVLFGAAQGVQSSLGAGGPFIADFSLTDSAAYAP